MSIPIHQRLRASILHNLAHPRIMRAHVARGRAFFGANFRELKKTLVDFANLAPLGGCDQIDHLKGAAPRNDSSLAPLGGDFLHRAGQSKRAEAHSSPLSVVSVWLSRSMASSIARLMNALVLSPRFCAWALTTGCFPLGSITVTRSYFFAPRF